MAEATERPEHRVVIVGGGFGGLVCARALDGEPVDVLLLDRHNYHTFTPLLYQVATSLLNPSDIAYPFRAVFRRSKNVRFRQAVVVDTDLQRKVLVTNEGEEVPFDSLVIATGSRNNYFANESLARHTVAMKSLSQALRLRNHVLSCLECAAHTGSEAERRKWLTFVIAGGGPTGVEYAGALSELLNLVLGHDFPELDHSLARVVLVEGQDRLLGEFHPKLGAYAAHTLGERGVEVRTSVLVRDASDETVVLSDGDEISTRTVVWSAGVLASDPLASAEAPRSRSRRLCVDDRLRLVDHPDVYVIGDASSVEEHDGELPMLAPPAMQAGRYVAREIVAALTGERGNRRPFRYVDKGTMATIGRRAAVADFHGLKLKGAIGWVAWLVVHLYYLIGFRNRAVVLASWAWDYLRRDRPIRLILRSDADRITEELEALGLSGARSE
jgi:NADH dehydrogenase